MTSSPPSEREAKPHKRQPSETTPSYRRSKGDVAKTIGETEETGAKIKTVGRLEQPARAGAPEEGPEGLTTAHQHHQQKGPTQAPKVRTTHQTLSVNNTGSTERAHGTAYIQEYAHGTNIGYQDQAHEKLTN